MDFDAALLERSKTFLPDRSRADGGLKVIACGLGRSGTTSLGVALDILGLGPVHHYQSLQFDANLSRDWIKAFEALNRGENVSKEQWNDIFCGFNVSISESIVGETLKQTQAAVGSPACHVADELANIYPDAKIIVNQRDFDAWVSSYTKNLWGKARVGWIWRLLVPALQARADLRQVVKRVTGFHEAGMTEDPRAGLRKSYDAHYAKMLGNIPVDRRLCWDLSDGWDPLCSFLDVPIPDQPFPHTHTSAEFKEKRSRVDPVTRKLARENVIWALNSSAVTIGILCVIAGAYRFRSKWLRGH
ncbi:Hypothetical predicted protein [Lecanosticta acicola]|uniref:P-loop containing nucleoside triphosphate hydrolase protein n=1 Tax=Lecanosticta acicola TaxID=111012 RepID=A0AAI9ECK8_9PEZI|nr:Hypothetical predicted protein [Lecanosticta acicola]